MRLGHVELFVRDLGAARVFYRDVLGLEDVTPDVEHVAWMKAGAMELLLRPGRPAQAPAVYDQATSGLVFYCEDLEATAGALRERGLVFRGMDGSSKCLTFQDPDGHWYQLVDPQEQ